MTSNGLPLFGRACYFVEDISKADHHAIGSWTPLPPASGGARYRQLSLRFVGVPVVGGTASSGYVGNGGGSMTPPGGRGR